jgi:hypothetical protein
MTEMIPVRDTSKSPVRNFFTIKKKKMPQLPNVSCSNNNNSTKKKSSSSMLASAVTDDTEESGNTATDIGEIESCLSDGGTNINIHVRNLAHPGIPTMGDGEDDDEADSTSTQAHAHAAVLNEKDDTGPVFAHPSLAALHVTDMDSKLRIHPNSEITHISNEWFEMDMLVMLRTPNVDDPSAPPGTDRNQNISKHFQGKKRRFEFQYQVKLKKKTDDKDLCFGMELDQPLKLTLFQKALVSTCLVFMKKMSPSFRCNIHGSHRHHHQEEDRSTTSATTSSTSSSCTGTGNCETSYMAFAVERALDRLAITPPGEVPPPLGTAIPEDLTRVQQRKEGKLHVDWNCDDTYTMAIWSHYIDWIQWQVVHIPGLSHFSMNHVLGDQPLYMQLYMLDKNRKDKNKHYQNDKEHVVNLKFQKRNEEAVTPKSPQPQQRSLKKKLHLFGR